MEGLLSTGPTPSSFQPVTILEPGGRRRPGLYGDIPVPVLQVPAGEEGGPGGLPNLLKEKEMEDDEGGEKKEDDDDDEEMEGKRRGAEAMQDIMVLEEGMMVNFPLPLVSFTCSSCFKVHSANKKLNNHIVDNHKDQT